ncbi:hypothetical protein AA309_15340 [Microvirga vignae]|uniref:Peptidase M10 serralysin C-terminal domain-containing protein n=1 Tax=Microvirga vignae TaxID=1225564 RepID=A0A0H1RAW6_9HYPH|nr:hypothetical protein [Microvirga vignae]KLK92350.1 hypothetical protein AA309_15340 [Microvirga vignae]
MRLTGNASSNTVKGNASANTLSGGLGSDTLHGGSGKAIFVFNTKPSSSSIDSLADYKVADDTIHLENGVVTKLADGKLASSAFWTGVKAHDRDDRIIHDSAKGYVYHDADGTGASKQVLTATTAKGLKMTYGEFHVIQDSSRARSLQVFGAAHVNAVVPHLFGILKMNTFHMDLHPGAT